MTMTTATPPRRLPVRPAFRGLAAALLLVAASLPAAAMVGGAAPAGDVGRSVVLIVGSHGTSCTGVALARDLVLTAAHCLLPGADYKLVAFDDARRPTLQDIATIARHPEFDPAAVARHRVSADVALLKPSAPLPQAPAILAPTVSPVAVGDRLVVAGYGLSKPGDGRSGGTVRAATLTVTGRPGTLQVRLVDPQTKGERAGLGACTGDSGAPVFRRSGDRLAVIGVVSWSTGPKLAEGCGGLTGMTPLTRYRAWIVRQAGTMGVAIGP
jgi:hypothetical protein